MVKVFIALLTLLLSHASITAACIEPKGDIREDTDPGNLSFEENLATPEVADHQKNKVRSHTLARAKELAAKKLKVETLRQGEVFVVVIPSDELFFPNDTLLRQDVASVKFRYLDRFFKKKNEYKVILVVHSDDTGSDKYRYAMTESRVQSLYDWFDTNFNHTENLFGYGVGSDMPVSGNDTANGRRANRRVEIYIIPDEKLLERL